MRRLDMAPACVNNEGSRDGKISGLDRTACVLSGTKVTSTAKNWTNSSRAVIRDTPDFDHLKSDPRFRALLPKS